MPQIIPHLWFDNQVQEAVALYSTHLPHSKINSATQLEGTPSGDVALLDFTLMQKPFQAINGGPYFTFNEAISLMVGLPTAEAVENLYQTLSPGGQVLMPLQEYPFSERYAWFTDRYGLHWQLMVDAAQDARRNLRPVLLFGAHQCGLAEAAMGYYASIFPNSQKGTVSYYAPGEAQSPSAKINYAELRIGDFDLVLMDHGYGGTNSFNEAISFIVLCKDQAEIDAYWDQLSHDPEAEQCGWLKDQFGVSWQIVPENMQIYMQGPKEAVARVTEAFLGMKKFDLKALEAAYRGE